MSEETFFIVKTSVEDMDLIDVGGTPVVDNFEALKAAIIQTAGRDAAELFAEPVYRRGNDRAPAVISWYANVPDDARPLSECEGQDRDLIEAKLRERLAPLLDGIADAGVGPMIGAALHLKDANCIYAVGGRPILVNWGMVPSSVGLTPNARGRHYGATLGAYLPLASAPPINAEELGALSERLGARAAAAEEIPEEPKVSDSGASSPNAGEPVVSHTGGGGGSGEPPAVKDRNGGGGRWRWIPLILLLLIMGLVLAYLLIPGTLLYPPETVSISGDESARIAEEQNDSLRRRRDELQRALDGAVCLDDGSLRFPATIDEAAERANGGTGDAGGTATSEDVVPPPPGRLEVPPPDGSTDAATDLLSFIEARTALVITEFQGGKGSGTGFFVGPDLLVTNDHVVYGASGDQAKIGKPVALYVKSEALGRVIRAELLASSGQSRGVGRDFALLRVPNANAQHFTVWNSEESVKLKPVIAAGFPSAYFKVDQEGRAIQDTQSAAVPDMVITQGTVNAQQNIGAEGVLSLIHSADISSGNSGGPLVDQCGRVVGVNTFGIQDEVTRRFLNFSLHTKELVRFAESKGHTIPGTDQACRPQVAERTQPPGPETPPEGETPAEPAEEGSDPAAQDGKVD